MPIKYYLQPNPINPDPNDQSARVLSGNVLNADDIIQRMLKRGTTLTETDMKAVLNLLFDVVSDEVAEGNNVNLPIANIKPSITGVFVNAADSFDATRHTKKATLSSGSLLIEKMQKASVEKILQPVPMPVLLEYQDINTGSSNSVLTSGGIGQIVGEELKFDINNSTEGVFLVAQSGTETKISIIATRTEGKLMFSIPTGLASGNYTLEVRRAYTKNSLIRKGTLNEVLTVA
jgi:hypothetical protein